MKASAAYWPGATLNLMLTRQFGSACWSGLSLELKVRQQTTKPPNFGPADGSSGGRVIRGPRWRGSPSNKTPTALLWAGAMSVKPRGRCGAEVGWPATLCGREKGAPHQAQAARCRQFDPVVLRDADHGRDLVALAHLPGPDDVEFGLNPFVISTDTFRTSSGSVTRRGNCTAVFPTATPLTGPPSLRRPHPTTAIEWVPMMASPACVKTNSADPHSALRCRSAGVRRSMVQFPVNGSPPATEEPT